MKCFGWMALATLIGAPSMALDLDISKPSDWLISLHPQTGEAIGVGSISFEPVDGGLTYRLDWDDSQFTDQFLSMRPFKCLEGPKKQWCRVPYPYENRRVVSEADLTDLEYDLMFIWKNQGDYGINMWNGVYYQIETAQGALIGEMNDMDMDLLSAPPDAGILRPIGEFDVEPADPDSHWLPKLVLTLQ